MAWLIGIARRCIEGERLRPQTLPATDDAADTLDVEADTVQRLTLESAVAHLDERDRELLALRYGSDLSARQIGELLELRTNAVEVALHRALGRLRKLLEGQDEPVPGASFTTHPRPL